MGRRSKYSPETIEAILDAIRETGSDKAGWRAGGICSTTFYEWCDNYPEFADSVKEAKAEYRKICPEELIKQARKAFSDYLFGRAKITITTFERGVSEKHGSYSREITKQINPGVPQWAIERVLGKPLDVLEAISTLAEAGILPKWLVEQVSNEISDSRKEIASLIKGELPHNPDESTRRPGLSDETANAIKAYVLGINPSDIAAAAITPGVTEVSEDVDIGSESD